MVLVHLYKYIIIDAVFFICRDFMDPTMDSTKHILNYLMPILEQVDVELHDFLIRYVQNINNFKLTFASDAIAFLY